MFLTSSGDFDAEIESVLVDTDNLNIATLFGNPTAPKFFIVNFDVNLNIGSTSTSTYSLSTNGLPSGSRVQLNLNASNEIFGRGGAGGSSGGGSGGAGGPAFFIDVPVTIDVGPAGVRLSSGGGGGGGTGFTGTGSKAQNCSLVGGGAGGAGAGSQNGGVAGTRGGALAEAGTAGSSGGGTGACPGTAGGAGGAAGNLALISGEGSLTFVGNTTGKTFGNIISI